MRADSSALEVASILGQTLLMPSSRQYRRKSAAGFSLIELMVALVAGLIVVGAVLAFTLASLRSNTELIQATRLTQELRNSIDYVSRELRRAGYDEDSMRYYSQASVGAALVSPFSALRIENGTATPTTPVNNACLIYSYDRQPGTSGILELANGEIRAIRRVVRSVNDRDVGVVESAESSAAVTPDCNGASPVYTTYPATCNTSSGWCPLSDSRAVDITAFVVTTNRNASLDATPTTSALQLRSLGVTLTGNLIGQPDVVRSVSTRVRVRADCLQTAAICNIGPTPTPTAP